LARASALVTASTRSVSTRDCAGPRPEHFVRRALGRTLFEDGMFRRSLTGGATTLDVELLDFEEVRTPRTHEARIAIRVVLASDRVLMERTVVTSRPVMGDGFDDSSPPWRARSTGLRSRSHSPCKSQPGADDPCHAPKARAPRSKQGLTVAYPLG
jgi:hypothetical protein